jgi:hypothetical protein
VVQPNGTLVVVAGDYSNERALNGSMVALRSTDGGVTFTRSTVSDLQAADNSPMRAISLPSVERDSNGTIYATWSDCRFRAGCSQNDLVLSTSTAQTWTAPARDHGAEAFLPSPRPTRRIPVTRRCVRVPRHLGQGPCLLGMSLKSATAARPGARRNDSTQSRSPPTDTAPEGVAWSVTISRVGAGSWAVPVFALATSTLKGRFSKGCSRRRYALG